MLSLSGHIGAKASSLVDGQLSPPEEERAWSHVLACPGCRRLVEREGWVKRQLGGLSATPVELAPPPALMGSLYDVDAWADVDEIERRSARRRTSAAVIGGGALSACVLGIIAVTGAPTARTDVPPSPASVGGSVNRPSGGQTPVVAPSREPTNHSRLRIGGSR